MKFVCYKDTIIKALNSVVKGVASKTTMPILEGILIQTNDDEIKLTTYDLEIGIEYTMKCDIVENGSTVVNATMFTPCCPSAGPTGGAGVAFPAGI